MRDELELTLFGSPEVRLHGLPVTGFRSSKAQALLYYLAVTGRPHTRSTLAGLLWGDQPDPAARASLSKCLSNLHDLVGDAVLIERQTIAFNRDCPYHLDTERFAAGVDAALTPETLQPLHSALALYRGDFLEGFYVRDAPDFEQWVLVQRAHYREAVVQGVHALAAFAEQHGDLPQAIAHTRRLLALEPWREEAHRQLMLLLARSGQRAAALAQFETCRRILDAELTVAPDAETIRVVNAIRAGEFDKVTRWQGDITKASKGNGVQDHPVTVSPPHRVMNNLPIPPTPLIGREHELAEVRDLLRSNRLVVLTGPGGIGKTRLAIEAAAAALHDFAQGAYFVNLAPISDPALVVAMIAQTLGITERGSRPLLERLKDELRAQELLLLLDNVEQVLDAAPQLAELLAGCPKLKLLVTSREVLHLYGEQEFCVPPLSLPDRAQLPPLDQLTQYEAVRLFIARARAAKADFAVTNERAPAVAEICYRLDGLPLAIELAAARIKLFSPQALLDRLSAPLALLIGGPRDRPTRQQTIRNTIDWSYNLLSENEQSLFRRLGVFVGGCTLGAIEAVASKLRIENEQLKNGLDDDTFSILNSQFLILNLVEALVDKSLLKQEEGAAGEPRFVMLETIRAYALERLEECGEGDAVRRRHIAFFMALTELAEPQLRGGPVQLTWYRRLEAEQDNLRAALAWSLSPQGDVELGLRLVGASGRFWDLRTYKSELRAWLEGLLARSAGAVPLPRASARAKALGWLAAATEEDYGHATTLLEEQLSLWREIGDRDGMADALVSLGSMARDQGDYAHAQTLAEEGLALFMEQETAWGIGWALQILGDVALDQGAIARATGLFQHALDVSRQADMQESIAWSLINLGRIAYVQGDVVRALPLFEETLALFRDLGERNGMAQVLLDLARIAYVQGDHDRAAGRFAESLVLCRKVQNVRDTGYCLAGLAGIAAASDQPECAARLFGAAAALRDSLGVPLPPVNLADYDRDVAATRAQLDAATFAAAWTEGQTMTLDDAVAYALVNPESTTAGSPVVSMNTTDITGVSAAQTVTLKALGAVEEHVESC